MSLSFMCTAGRGTEKFVEEELRPKFDCVDLKTSDGKIYFDVRNELDVQLDDLLNLKSIERIFIKIYHFKTSRLPYGKGKGQFLNALKRRLVKKEPLIKSLQTFSKLHGGLKTQTDSLEPAPKKSKLHITSSPSMLDKDRQREGGSIRFRISCKLSGQISRLITSQEVNVELGKHVTKITGWRVDLTSPLLEITVHINDEVVVAGIPIISTPISKRSYILHHGLRSTVAWIISHLADIQVNDVVMDPMCGKSTILIEAAITQPGGVYIGCDKDKQQLRYSILNKQHAGVDMNFLHTDTLHLPLKDESVDKIICDAPFGQKHKTVEEIKTFYIKLLQQIYRVLKFGGKMVLLTSSRLRFHVLQILKQSHKDIVANTQPTATHYDNIQEDIPEIFSGIQDLKQTHNNIIPNYQPEATHNDKIQKDIPGILSKNETQGSMGNFSETTHHRPISKSLHDDNSLKTSPEKSSIISSENRSLNKTHVPIRKSLDDNNSLKTFRDKSSKISSENSSLVDNSGLVLVDNNEVVLVANSDVPVVIPSKCEFVYMNTGTSLGPDIQHRERHGTITSNMCDDNYSQNESRNDSCCLATKTQHVTVTSKCAIDDVCDDNSGQNESRNDVHGLATIKTQHKEEHVTIKTKCALNESRDDSQCIDPKIDKHVTSKCNTDDVCDNSQNESRNDRQLLHYVEDHYIKLGETHAYIIVAVKL